MGEAEVAAIETADTAVGVTVVEAEEDMTAEVVETVIVTVAEDVTEMEAEAGAMEVAEADVMMDMMIVAIETEATTVGMTTELELEPGKKNSQVLPKIHLLELHTTFFCAV